MSHFTVTVRISESRLAAHDGDHEAALAAMLAPYQENSMGDCPRQFLEFTDDETEYAAEYENGTDTWIDLGPANNVAVTNEIDDAGDRVISETERVHRGRRIVRSWHDMFRVSGSNLFDRAHKVPAHLNEVEIPYRELHTTLDAFVADYHGVSERDPDKQRYGHWENPQRKWDWYVIGGRWRSFFPTKPGTPCIVGEADSFDSEPKNPTGSDVVNVGQIDFDAAAVTESERFAKFKSEYRQLLAGHKFQMFEDPRDRALDIGLVRIEHDPAAALRPGEVQIGRTWGEDHPHIAGDTGPDGRAYWRDVALALTDEQFERYRGVFQSAEDLRGARRCRMAQARQDGAITDHTPDTYLAFSDAFMAQFIRAASPGDLLVLVDCHI